MSDYVDICNRATISDSMAHQTQQSSGCLEMSDNVPSKNSCVHSVRHLATYRHSNFVTLRMLQLIVTDFAARIMGNKRSKDGATDSDFVVRNLSI